MPKNISTTPASDTAPRKRAQRLSPERRREMILETAAELISERRACNFTLDEVATRAEVSRPLIHRYFNNRDELLRELVNREMDLLVGKTKGLVPDDETTEEAHRIYIQRHFEYVRERGQLFHLLMNGAISGGGEAGETVREGSRRSIAYWTERTVKTYGLSPELARMGMIMTIKALEGSEGSLRLGKVDVETASDFWTEFVLGGWKATAEKFGKPTTDPYTGSGDE